MDGLGTNGWWMKKKVDIRVTVFVLVHSQSNLSQQVLLLLGPRVAQLWGRAHTARGVRSWKETQLPWRRLYLFCDEAVEWLRIPCQCDTCEWGEAPATSCLGNWTWILQTCAALEKRIWAQPKGRSEACAKMDVYILYMYNLNYQRRYIGDFHVFLSTKVVEYSPKRPSIRNDDLKSNFHFIKSYRKIPSAHNQSGSNSEEDVQLAAVVRLRLSF